MELFTIGYEGITIREFTERLLSYKIDIVADVRLIPISRKPKFSKNSLAKELVALNIQYVHYGDLGTPQNLRDKLHATRDYRNFRAYFAKYLETKTPILKEIGLLIRTNRVALMCFEHDPEKCHRSIIAAKMKEIDENGLTIRSL